MGSTAIRGISVPVALRLGRVSNLPTVWTNVLAGASLAGGPLAPGPMMALLLAMSLFYVAGMYLNDAFDAGYDRLQRPGRPIPSGAAQVSTVLGMGAAMIAVGFALLTAIGWSEASGLRGVEAGLGLAAAIVFYDFWHKANPVGPMLMGLCRMLVYVTAAASLAGVVPRDVVAAAAVALCYLIGLTYAAKQEDLTQPGSMWPLIFLAVPFIYVASNALTSLLGAILFFALLGAVVYALRFLIRLGRPDVPRAIPVLIAGICLLDGLFIAGSPYPGWAMLGIIGFILTLLLQRWVPGT